MGRRPPLRLLADKRASATAEMALVAPFLVFLMMGAFDLGNYFLDQHVVTKAVRDGARYAGRQAFTAMPCGGTASNETQIKNVVRTGSPSGSTPRLPGWTDAATITVTISCDNTGTYTGIYTGLTGGAKRVAVSAAVPYMSLFGTAGFDASALTMTAASQSAVMGI